MTMGPLLQRLYGWNILLATVMMMIASTNGLKCYFCTVKKPSKRLNVSAKLCSRFNGTDDYIIDCPLSTFCETKTFRLHTQTETVSVMTRGCAKHKTIHTNNLSEGNGSNKLLLLPRHILRDVSIPDLIGVKVGTQSTVFCSSDLCNWNINHAASPKRSYLLNEWILLYLLYAFCIIL
ncbi:unnamed protein product [Lepeophtheirus salmonis]|uniref:(salmon louse) hypothetical protein n=1 Tax=Lepeophtheirus salmonis TaxID=72036 RepID=A0A7R8H7U7_LEPSM|nr:unnamed protein product [Lepeophtheirus salmonis]CAF2929042.1 unnamed protein product [Lepeophtheirus salmonis]